MRTVFLIPACGALLFAQSDKTMFTTDINGHRVTDAISDTTPLANGTSKRELSQSVNGRTVPLEKTEQHVTKNGNKTTTETIVTKFDPTGNLSYNEKTISEREDMPNGGSTETLHTYRSDVSGNLKEMERRDVTTRVQGSTTTQDIVLARPGLDGSFQTAEKKSSEAVKNGDRTDTKEIVYRRSQSGELYPALQQVKVETTSGATTTDQVAEYEPSLNGVMQLARQTVSTSTKDKAGNETREVNLYAPAADGHVQENGARQEIKEQQLITRHVGSDGSVVETLSVRRPTLADPGRLGATQKISETVCTGKCGTP